MVAAEWIFDLGHTWRTVTRGSAFPDIIITWLSPLLSYGQIRRAVQLTRVVARNRTVCLLLVTRYLPFNSSQVDDEVYSYSVFVNTRVVLRKRTHTPVLLTFLRHLLTGSFCFFIPVRWWYTWFFLPEYVVVFRSLVSPSSPLFTVAPKRSFEIIITLWKIEIDRSRWLLYLLINYFLSLFIPVSIYIPFLMHYFSINLIYYLKLDAFM